jgi:hypothetical protein
MSVLLTVVTSLKKVSHHDLNPSLQWATLSYDDGANTTMVVTDLYENTNIKNAVRDTQTK